MLQGKRSTIIQQSPSPSVCLPKGACTNDVSREGEGGGYPNSDGRRGGCVISIVKILTRGEGVKNPENLADVICEWPQTFYTRD